MVSVTVGAVEVDVKVVVVVVVVVVGAGVIVKPGVTVVLVVWLRGIVIVIVDEGTCWAETVPIFVRQSSWE